jgi:hypothetical protein
MDSPIPRLRSKISPLRNRIRGWVRSICLRGYVRRVACWFVLIAPKTIDHIYRNCKVYPGIETATPELVKASLAANDVGVLPWEPRTNRRRGQAEEKIRQDLVSLAPSMYARVQGDSPNAALSDDSELPLPNPGICTRSSANGMKQFLSSKLHVNRAHNIKALLEGFWCDDQH